MLLRISSFCGEFVGGCSCSCCVGVSVGSWMRSLLFRLSSDPSSVVTVRERGATSSCTVPSICLAGIHTLVPGCTAGSGLVP